VFGRSGQSLPGVAEGVKVFGSLSLPLLLLIFGGAAALVWVADIRLSNTTDVLSSRLGLGEALWA
jgi:cation:H+ antiporter